MLVLLFYRTHTRGWGRGRERERMNENITACTADWTFNKHLNFQETNVNTT